MGGASLGSMFGGGASTMGAGGISNTTPSVMGAQGKLEAFNPATMAGTYTTPTTPTMNNFQTAGLDQASGLPTYVTNFLQQGGTGDLHAPQYTMDPGEGVIQKGFAKAPIKHANKPLVQAPGGVPPKVTTSVAAKTATPAAAATAPKTTMIPMNASGGYSMPGHQAPQVVSDVYYDVYGSLPTAGNNPMSSSGIGQQAQMPSGPIYTDNKGGYYSDAAGKMPLTGAALNAAQKIFRAMGYA